MVTCKIALSKKQKEKSLVNNNLLSRQCTIQTILCPRIKSSQRLRSEWPRRPIEPRSIRRSLYIYYTHSTRETTTHTLHCSSSQCSDLRRGSLSFSLARALQITFTCRNKFAGALLPRCLPFGLCILYTYCSAHRNYYRSRSLYISTLAASFVRRL